MALLTTALFFVRFPMSALSLSLSLYLLLAHFSHWSPSLLMADGRRQACYLMPAILLCAAFSYICDLLFAACFLPVRD
jgi:hypothetical protein